MTEQQAIKRIKDEIGWESSELNKEAFNMGIKALGEVQQYREIGTVKEIRIKMAEFMVLSKRYLSDLSELMKYQAIGTVEELKEAEEKQNPKKILYREQSYGTPYLCPECEADQIKTSFANFDGSKVKNKHTYCWYCGQKLDWGNEDAE